MKYQFDVTLTTSVLIMENNEDKADEKANEKYEALIAGSKLEKEYPDGDFTLEKQDGDFYLAKMTYEFEMPVEETSIEQAKLNAEKEVFAFIQGSELAEFFFSIQTELSDDQPGLDDLLDWIDPDQIFAVQEPGERYHYECALEIFGEKRIDRAARGKEDDLTVIYGREWEHDVREAFLHEEEIYSSCGACRGSLYDEPKKAEEGE